MYKIAVVRGDGIGPEIIEEGLKVLRATSEAVGPDFEFIDVDAGGEVYLERGEVIPDESMDIMDESDAIYFGAVGLPADRLEPGIAEGAIFRIRFSYDQYVNLRPTKLFPGLEEFTPVKPEIAFKGVDMVIVRENTEGLYSRQGGILRGETPEGGDAATNVMIYTRKGVERVVRYAFELAKRTGGKRVTNVDKANVLDCSRFWTSIFDSIATEYPGIETDHAYVDAFTQWAIRNPSWYQVVVTENMFGDIISDLVAPLAGSLGMMPGGNISPGGKSMFEPIHGSAPRHAGKNVANPIATILAGKMMLEEAFDERKPAALIESAVREVIAGGEVRTYDICGKRPGEGASTSQMGDAIADAVRRLGR
ncbi:MAG: isocitrate/isopropylmalate dehydrogenase family protein [Theionarchaea archaeon]|nr:isocitrate/isopropylmalate dehydrogenase family protein [Theionarchaea archaeon]